MTSREIRKTLTFQRQVRSLLRPAILLCLSLVALIVGHLYAAQMGFGTLLAGAILTGVFSLFLLFPLLSLIRELSLSKTYSVHPGRVVATEESQASRSLSLLVEYEDPTVRRGRSHACFSQADGRYLLNKPVKVATSPKSQRLLILP